MAKAKRNNDGPRLFKEKLVPADPGSGQFFKTEYEGSPDGAVECLGMTFPSDQKRREHFLEKLREKLKDPEFRKIEGFPIGADEDILALSDPPYYTACPNPFIADFVNHYGKPYNPKKPYSREPFAADVSVARHDHYTLGHTYHTKVSPLAIAQYIQHFTSPGDVVLDCFSGSGMTGLATAGADLSVSSGGKSILTASSPRIALLVDLGIGATHIANGNILRATPAEIKTVSDAIRNLAATSTLFRTCAGGHSSRQKAWKSDRPAPDAKRTASLEYLVWSEVLICPNCGSEVVFGNLAFDFCNKEVNDQFECSECRRLLEKRQCKRKIEQYFDTLLNKTAERITLVPLFAAIDCDGNRFYRKPLANDAPSVDIKAGHFPLPLPIMKGERYFKDALYDIYRVAHVHQFFTERNLLALADMLDLQNVLSPRCAALLRFVFTSIAIKCSKLMNYNADGVGRVMKGTLYGSSLVQECNPYWLAEISLRDIERLTLATRHERRNVIISTQSAASILLPEATVDYVWVDPPFGKNLMYAELNQLWEWWLRVRTAAEKEAVIDERRSKDIGVYTTEMYECFRAAYRALKPGRWITIEFHNSKNAVWNAIQEALTKAGFVVADVRMLDKRLMTYKQSQQGLVKVDLIISAYKPNGGLEERFRIEAGTTDGVWDFTRTHLKQLPVFVSKDGNAEVIAERQDYLLFDRMVAFHVQRGVALPMSSAEYYAGLAQRFSQRDGMYFDPEQVAEYDRRRLTVREVLQLQLFVTDESSAIQWLRQQLLQKPQTAGDLKPRFMQEIGGWQKNEKLLELDDLLHENFLRYDGAGNVPEQIHSYLSSNWKELRNLAKDDTTLRAKGKDRWYVPDPNKLGDLEKLRERSLLREFDDYRTSAQKRLKVFRFEAVRAGFKKAWQERDYDTIIAVAQKIPEEVLQEDPKLLMWYDQAMTRKGETA